MRDSLKVHYINLKGDNVLCGTLKMKNASYSKMMRYNKLKGLRFTQSIYHVSCIKCLIRLIEIIGHRYAYEIANKI